MDKDFKKGSSVKSEISPADGKPMLVAVLLEHTIENCNNAKKFLIETGSFTEEDFENATQFDVECGYLLGEPLLCNGDDCTSALKLWNEKIFWDTHEECLTT